ncbi:membrane metallo-endopeptidase-like 1 [Rhipicephalus sanguineus]|uniref:membrane metallo-endopeptidase-like 1 n=1 Tax=Rhipicephalus sanguineus TaxID=34632 RepID=UPI0020C472FA|nr:membrane metallo-endopeptidase-like 1 [Rhipicephalus sanguineus]
MWIDTQECSKQQKLYRRLIRSVLSVMLGQENNEDNDSCSKKGQKQKHHIKDDGSDPVHKITAEIVEIEMNLAKMSLDAIQEAEGSFSVDSIKNWQEKFGEGILLYESLLADISKARGDLEKSDEIIVHNLKYFQSLSKYLERLDKRKFHNYVGWWFIREIADVLTLTVREKLNQFLQQTTKPGIAVTLDQNTCVKKLIGYNGIMAKGIAFLYLKRYFQVASVRKAGKVARRIKEGFLEVISDNAWMDQTTKYKMKTWVR